MRKTNPDRSQRDHSRSHSTAQGGGLDVACRFENGLRFRARTRPLYNVDEGSELLLTLTIGAGAAMDPPGKSGLAHVVEHLVRRNKKEVLEAVLGDNAQALIQVPLIYHPAWTDFECTHFAFDWKSEQAEGVFRFARRMLDSTRVNAKNLARAKGEVLREIEAYQANHVLSNPFHSLYRLAFGSHPYGRYVLGNSRDIPRLTVRDCQEFLARYYRPVNAMVFANITCDKPNPDLVKSILEFTGSYLDHGPWFDAPPRGTRSALRGRVPAVPRQTFRCEVVESEKPYHALAIGLKVRLANSRASLALELISELLFGPGTPLRTRHGTNLEVHCPNTFQAGLYEILLIGKGSDPHFGEDFLEALFDGFVRLRAAEATEAEIERAKSSLRAKDLKIHGETGVAEWRNISDYGRLRNTQEMIWNESSTPDERLARVDEMTSGELRHYASEFLRAENLSVHYTKSYRSKP